MGIGNIPPAKIFGYEFLSKTAYYYLVLIVCAICIYSIYKLVNSRIGRAWITIKENEALAKSVGVNVFQYANIAFIVGAFFAGLAGSLYAHYVNFVSPDLFLFFITTELLVMMIMGGKGTVAGPVIGAIIFSMLPEYLRIAEKWRLPIFGAILIVGILFLPNGIVKLPSRVQEWRARRPGN
jgi:branched-chain amino acid transport system permease protein